VPIRNVRNVPDNPTLIEVLPAPRSTPLSSIRLPGDLASPQTMADCGRSHTRAADAKNQSNDSWDRTAFHAWPQPSRSRQC